MRGGDAVLGDRPARGDRGLRLGRRAVQDADARVDAQLDALLDGARHVLGFLQLADELRRLVEHQVAPPKPLKRLPLRRHDRPSISGARESRRDCVDGRLARYPGEPQRRARTLTRRFPSAASPTRPSLRRRRFGTSASSPTSTTASRRWPTGCCGITGVVADRDMRAQYLDRMDIERERGITIKAQNVRLPWAGRRRRGLRPAPDRHARATSTSPTRCPARWRPARARCCWSTPPRASRRRRWRTSTWRWTGI